MAQRLVFVDVDGTLVNHNQEVPVSAQKALAVAAAAGHQLVLCTGRSKPEVYPALLNLGFRGLVGSNGSYGEMAGAAIFDDRMPEDDVAELASWFDSNRTACFWTTPDAVYSVHDFIDLFRPSDGVSKPAAAGDWTAYLRQIGPYIQTGVPKTANKVTFFLSADSGVRLADARERFGRQFSIVSGSMPQELGETVELTALGMDKSVGLKKMAARLGFAPGDTVALGDSANDIAMLRSAGTGIAMGNGTPEAKEAADWVTAPIDDDGLALAFERLGLTHA
ncbi:MAG: Cof-type HAD-IIB family hydrolase [Bifidobacterium subtile]|jgi:Cof subfamily protein (haloacid dehalogenase superfamily)|nr:Cof-type HAD-IIB family hydrolase [Bifidobacterium subtile]MCI1241123.1 Cof-type HAD-IIB family hydrolase [Bifidobacterium subtile]MCI1258311.1 Cof-type HAD-IIB family hydrolase [Bifidobacterium subtile]